MYQFEEQLQKLQRKKVKIVAGTGYPYEQVDTIFDSHGNAAIRRLHRVGVKNVGGVTIDRVEVQLEKIEPPTQVRTPVPLRVMHDRPVTNNAARREFSLDLDQTEYIDVVMKDEWPGNPAHPFVVPHTVTFVQTGMDPRRYEFTIFAHGDGAEPDRAVFLVDLDDNNRLRVQPKQISS